MSTIGRIMIPSLFLFLLGCSFIEQAEVASQKTETAGTFWAHRHQMIMDVAYGPDPEQRLDIYTYGKYIGEPTWFKRSDDQRPTLVWIHGGGWRFGNKETDAGFFTHFLERGWNVVNVEYRRGLGTAPDAAEDVLTVMQWIKDHAEEYRFDTRQIVVSGASAGGHLALLAGLVNSVPDSHPAYVGDKLRIQAIINWYGPTDLQTIEAYFRTHRPDTNVVLNWVEERDKIEEISKKYSPVHYVTEKAPPVLSIQGDLDSWTPYRQAQLLHEKLDSVGAKNQLLTLKGGTHLGFTEDQFQLIFETIFKFLKAHP